MTTTNDHQRHEIKSADARRRQIRVMQVIFAGAATIATLALFNVARPGDAETGVASGSVQLVDQATELPAPATARFEGFAADNDDPADIANQAAQQAQQQADDQNDAIENQMSSQEAFDDAIPGPPWGE